MSEEREQFLRAAQEAAEHVADATEVLVFRMLTHGGIVSHTVSPSMGLGILVGPADVILRAKAHALEETGVETLSSGQIMRTAPRPDRTKPCEN